MEETKIIGHKRVLSLLSHSITENKTGHGYLFYGQDKVGKMTVAKWMATKIIGSEKKDWDRNLRIMEAEKGLKIADVRSVQHDLSLSNPFGDKRVIIMAGLQNMTIEAQNAFLKLLEEPNEGVVFILLATNLKKVLPTIISRVQQVRFGAVASNEIEAALLDRGTEKAVAKSLSRLANGSPGWVFGQENPELTVSEYKNEVLNLIKLFRSGTGSKFDFVQSLVDDGRVEKFVVLFEILLRDLMMCKNRQDEALTFVFSEDEIKNLSKSLSRDSLVSFWDSLGHLREQIKRNVNKKLALENYFLNLEIA